MAEYKGNYPGNTRPPHEGCDVRVWSGACMKSAYTNPSDKYLCDTCGEIPHLQHEIHHEHFPHLSGETDNLS